MNNEDSLGRILLNIDVNILEGEHWRGEIVSITPKRIAVNGDFDADWTESTWKLWHENASIRFKVGEWCSSANYFTPRPYRNEYDRGSASEGFVYVVQPGQRVCMWERISR